jgi:seryl-tRNA synthetase
VPNLPHDSVPFGRSEADNPVAANLGRARRPDFTPLEHWDLGPRLQGLDFERAAKITGARFALLTGWAARLERALINFMLDLHTGEHGYLEPAAVHREPGQHDRHRPVAQVRGGPVQAGRDGLLS